MRVESAGGERLMERQLIILIHHILSQKIDAKERAKEFFLFLNIEFIKLCLHIHNR